MVSVSNLEDIPSLDLYPASNAPGYFRTDSPEVLRVDSVGRPAGAESPLSPPRTPRTPPSAPHKQYRKPNPGKYVLQKIKKRPLSVSNTLLQVQNKV